MVSLGEIALRFRRAPGMGAAYALLPRTMVREIMPVAANAARATVPWDCMDHWLVVGPKRP